MNHLEIIQIRTAKTNQKALNEFLRNWLFQVNENSEIGKVKIYKCETLETDYSVHIELRGKIDCDKFQLGERMALALKEFGIVNRSVWVEQKLKRHENG